MSFLTVLPLIFTFQMLTSGLFGNAETLTEEQKTVVFLLSVPWSFLITTMLNAAGCFAVRAMPAAKQGKQR
jgi:hypothetical protein